MPDHVPPWHPGWAAQQAAKKAEQALTRRWPDDDEIEQALARKHGVVGLVAEEYGVDPAELSAHIGKRPDLQKHMRRAAQRAEDNMLLALRKGVQHGDIASIALYNKYLMDRKKADGAIGAEEAGPIDFTKEVRALEDFSDAELLAAVKQRAGDAPVVGQPCPCCGRLIE